MTRYYYQTVTESGSFSSPMPDDYDTADSLADLKAAFYAWRAEVRTLSDAPVSLVVFKGAPEGLYSCDCCPDFIIETGPRDGAVISNC